MPSIGWKKGIPRDEGNNYYWVYNKEYDISRFCQKTINGKFVWFSADGVSEMVPTKGVSNFKKLWWYKLDYPSWPWQGDSV